MTCSCSASNIYDFDLNLKWKKKNNHNDVSIPMLTDWDKSSNKVLYFLRCIFKILIPVACSASNIWIWFIISIMSRWLKFKHLFESDCKSKNFCQPISLRIIECECIFFPVRNNEAIFWKLNLYPSWELNAPDAMSASIKRLIDSPCFRKWISCTAWGAVLAK